MKRILFLLLLISGIAQAQDMHSVIYDNCDQGGNGIEEFYLESDNITILYEVLGEAEFHNYLDYNVTIHETLSNANNGVMPLGEYYTNTIPYLMSLYARVEEIATGDFEIVEVILRVNQNPVITQPADLTAYSPTGFAVFDLTSQNDIITGGDPDLVVEYYRSRQDGGLSNMIYQDSAYTNVSNPQVIWALVFNMNIGCTTITTFNLIVEAFNPNQIINFPDANFKAKLLSATPTNFIAYNFLNQYVKIDSNNDGEIQYSEALNIKQLNVSNGNILDLTGIEAFANLRSLDCSYNRLTSLNLSVLTQLEYLACVENQITTLNIDGLAELRQLYCYRNSLTSLDLSSSNNWDALGCGSNRITSLDLSTFTNYVPGNTELNLNDNRLTTLIVKNGIIDNGYMDLAGNPTLQFVCVDDSEIAYFQNKINDYGYTNCVVNSYCSFTPGGNYNTITGKVIFDSNSNGCDVSDLAQPLMKVKINDGTNAGSTFTNTAGDYKFYTQAGNFTVTPEIENPTFFNSNPANAVVNFPLANNSVSTNNFCLSANGNHPDLEIVVAPVVPARPGFEAVYKVVYKNKGNQTMSQNYGISFFYNQHLASFVSATVAPESNVAGGLNWSYANLMPFESRSFYVTLRINAPTATNPVNIDDVLTFTASIMPVAGDATVADNLFAYDQTVVGSYDPNDITCLQGDVVPASEIGNYLHYMIRFENTGNYHAENVVVKEIIDLAKYDIESLQVLGTSHAVDARIRGNIAEFIFQSINLDSGGHGNVLLKLKSKSTLVTGDQVSKKASIYFDYNFPIVTNDANTVFQSLSIGEHHLDNSIKMYPNPANEFVSVKASGFIKSVEFYDVQGRILQTNLVNERETKLDLSKYASGIYYLKIKTDKGYKIEKLVKK